MDIEAVKELAQMVARLEADYHALLLAISASGVVYLERVPGLSDFDRGFTAPCRVSHVLLIT
ncbi:MAG: hypothetical protein WAL71_02260 [Terriglobales bacterium]|jgi:hypothetical protein